MRFATYSHRFGLAIADEDRFREEWGDIVEAITSITDADIQYEHEKNTPERKSISKAINNLLYKKFKKKGWKLPSVAACDKYWWKVELPRSINREGMGCYVLTANGRCGGYKKSMQELNRCIGTFLSQNFTG